MTANAHPRILLVEDNPGDVRYIRELLRDAVSFERRAPGESRFDGDPEDAPGPEETVVHESRLADGLDRLDDADVDVVLLDLDLPDSSGLDTLTTLLDHDDGVPVVVLTGLRDRDAGVRALREGAEEFLVKDEINPGLLVRSIHHAIERREHRREQQRYEALIEESTDVNAIVAPDGTFEYVTPSADHVLGYQPSALEGENAFAYVHPDDRVAVREEFDRLLADEDHRATVDVRFRAADGDWVVLNVRGRNLLDDPAVDGFVVYSRDVTDQREYERRLAAQRERLAALNQLNGVVHGVTAAVIDQSSRAEIERIACERLAESDAYEFAWIGEADAESREVAVRASAGTDGYLEDVSVTTDPDDPEGEGPTGRAIRSGEVHVVRDVHRDADFEPWRDAPEEYGFQSSAAIPIRHEGTTYGVLNVYADRPDAFREQERDVVEHLGRLVGHAIAAAERKQALMSDTVVELELRVAGATDALGVSETPEGPLELSRTIPLGDERFLVYGTVDDEEFSTLEAMAESVPYWESVERVGEHVDGARFELRVDSPPMMTAVASRGGSVERVLVEGDDIRMTVHLPEDVEVRDVVEVVRDHYDGAEAIARRQVAAREDRSERLADVWADELTDRQRTVVETAFFAGFFEWPRATSGEEVADRLDIAGATFSQHLRAAERKVFAKLVGADPDQTDPGE
ncbi:bacterio-opsin activator domain-containing protein [Halobacterium yunchengense]|uniref:bacterio-opsin activator domain-containing protein n=1 Tax=Halobacterium yunchengense TaxID=3108497 RepID=UPI00300A459A